MIKKNVITVPKYKSINKESIDQYMTYMEMPTTSTGKVTGKDLKEQSFGWALYASF